MNTELPGGMGNSSSIRSAFHPRKELNLRFFSLKMLIFRIKFGHRDDQDFHFPDRPMECPAANVDTIALFYREYFPVELHFGVFIAFEEIIDFSVRSMKVFSGILGNLRDMNCSGKILCRRKAPFRCAARTGNARHLVEVDKFKRWEGRFVQ